METQSFYETPTPRPVYAETACSVRPVHSIVRRDDNSTSGLGRPAGLQVTRDGRVDTTTALLSGPSAASMESTRAVSILNPFLDTS